MRFPVRKLLDWEGHEEELAADKNLIGTVVLAHLKTNETRCRDESRLRWKVRILHWLDEHGWPAEEYVDLFRALDLMMALPQDLEEEFDQELARLQEEKKMPVVIDWERRVARRAEQRARIQQARDMLRDVLEARFGRAADPIVQRVRRTEDLELLGLLHKRAATAGSLDEFQQALPQ